MLVNVVSAQSSQQYASANRGAEHREDLVAAGAGHDLPGRDGRDEHAEDDRAARIGTDTATLLKSHGFYEYFDPVDGRGLGGDSFTWTGGRWLYWAQHYA